MSPTKEDRLNLQCPNKFFCKAINCILMANPEGTETLKLEVIPFLFFVFAGETFVVVVVCLIISRCLKDHVSGLIPRTSLTLLILLGLEFRHPARSKLHAK